MTTSHNFPKNERLKSKKTLARLFKEGRSFSVYPIRVVWLKESEPKSVPLQFTVSVPKKRFKNAVDRNRIKRQIREAYRLNKSELISKLSTKLEKGETFALMMIYVSTENETYAKIEKSLRRCLERLSRDMSK